LGRIQPNYSLGRIILVADKGLTTGYNIWHIFLAKNGYVLSYSGRGADKSFKDYVLEAIGEELNIDLPLHQQKGSIF